MDVLTDRNADTSAKLDWFFGLCPGIFLRKGEEEKDVPTVFAHGAGSIKGVSPIDQPVPGGSCSPQPDEEDAVRLEDNKKDNSSAMTAPGSEVTKRLAGIRASLTRLCSDTDPLFIQIGRELRRVSAETRSLAGSMQETAHLVSDEKSESGILDRMGDLIQGIMDSLTDGRSSIESSMAAVRELVAQIENFHSIIDQIDIIGSRLRVVRINIRIQCSSRLIREEMFQGMTDDINSLTRKLRGITAQLKKDLSVAVQKLSLLEHSVSRNLSGFEAVSIEARKIVSRAFDDIRQLMDGVVIMIKEAGERSRNIAEKVDEVVVCIQFHDSLTQRVEHILQAFDDVNALLDRTGEDFTPDSLGTAWLILDLQYRQLSMIVNEIAVIKRRIQGAFKVMEQEVSGLDAIHCHRRFKALGPQQFLSSLFASLRAELMKLCSLLSSSSGMLREMRASARETGGVAGKLQELMGDIREMREDTRLNAANTIIMASSLGQQGNTIHVLAMEINRLSVQTGTVTDAAERIQAGINNRVAILLESSGDNPDAVDLGEVEGVTRGIWEECRAIEARISGICAGIKNTCGHIEEIGTGLSFLEDFRTRLAAIDGWIGETRDLLTPWKDCTTKHSAEMDQLIERYTMELERAVHGFKPADEQDQKQRDEDIFF